MIRGKRLMGLVGLGVLALALSLAACAGLQSEVTFPDRHPEALEKGRAICTDCHEAYEEGFPYGDFDHEQNWAQVHRFRSYQHTQVCSMCHETDFCNQCHATRVELKPSIRREVDTYRALPHRGDYLSRHRIDGRIDPTSCFRCHGNPKSSKTCKPCHG